MTATDSGWICSDGVAVHPDEIRGQNGVTAAVLAIANTKDQKNKARNGEHVALNVFNVQVSRTM